MIPVWSPEAINDLVALPRLHRAGRSESRSTRRASHRPERRKLLPSNPEMGRPGRVPGTRELVIPKTPFIVLYRLVGNTVQILRVFHGARRWPRHFERLYH